MFIRSLLLAALVLEMIAGAPFVHAQVFPVTQPGFGQVVVHAGKTIALSGAARVYGNVSMSPGANLSVLSPGFISGAREQNTAVAQQTAANLAALYQDLQSRPCEFNVHRDAGNVTYTPGSYCAVADILFRGESILDAQGKTDAIFLFQVPSNLVTADNSRFTLKNGAKAEHVYFVSGTYVVLGANSTFSGNLIAQNNVQVGQGAVVKGRVASMGGNVDVLSAVVGAAASADLSLQQTVNATTIPEGDLLVYTLTLRNAGPDAATGVVVRDQIPAGFELVNGVSALGIFANHEWNVGTLAAGASAVLEITVRPSAGMEGKTVQNTAEVWQATSVDPDSVPANGAQGEDDVMTVYVTVGAPRPVSSIPLNWFHPNAERDAAATIDMNQPSVGVGNGSVGPVTLPCTPGSLFRGSLPAVYYCTVTGKRLVFPDNRTYATWYADYSKVVKISDAALAKIPLAGVVMYRPGVKLVKIQTDPKVYAVSKQGTLRPIASEAVALALYGPNWNKMIEDIPDAFFFNYKIGEPIME